MHGSYYGGASPRTATQTQYNNGYIQHGSPRQAGMPTANGGPANLFRSRQERVDWRRLASIDVDRITREHDTSVLQEFVNNITYCDIEQETDMRTVDPNYLKLFKLAQLIIEYLIHSQSYLSNSIEAVQDQVRQANDAHNATKQELTKATEELHKVKQESRKRRKQITAQQSIMGLGPNGYHKCPYCEKAFIHAAYLQSHLKRKHEEFMTQTEDIQARKDNERLETEMEEMRDKLRLTESQFEEERRSYVQQIETHKATQSRVDIDRLEEQQRIQAQNDRWKQEQLDMQRSDVEKMQGMFMKELKEIHQKYSALDDLQSKFGKQSMLGKMQDEDEIAEYKDTIRKQHKDQEKLKKLHAKEVSSIKFSMQEELKSTEWRWKERSRQQKESHKEEVERLKGLLEQVSTSLKIEREGGDQIGHKYEQQMKNLVKKNKEFEKDLKERDRQIKELKMDLRSKPKTPVPSPSPKPRSPTITMAPPSDEEMESEEESQESEQESVEDKKHQLDTLQKKKLVQGMRESLEHILANNLAKKGVPENVNGISSQSLENKLRVLKEERQNLAKRHSKFYDIRRRWKTELDERVKKGGKMATSKYPMMQQGNTSGTRPSSASSVHKSSSQWHSKDRFASSQPRYSSTPVSSKTVSNKNSSASTRSALKTPPPVALRGEQIYDVPPNNRLAQPSFGSSMSAEKKHITRVSFDEPLDDDSGEDEDDDDDDESEDISDEDESEDEEGEIRTNSNKDQRSNLPTSSKKGGITRSRIEEGDEDDSEWDSEDISELQEISPSKVTGGSKGSAQKQKSPGKTPQGPKVAELTRSIERQLSGRRNDKKPAGGIDLGNTNDSDKLRPDSRDDGRSPSPQIPTLPDDWDDSDSLAVSSLEGSLSVAKPVPIPRQSKPPSSNSQKPVGDTDVSSNTLGTSVWGSSSNKGSASGGTGETAKSSLVSVTDFDDDDDDFNLSSDDL